MCLPVSGMYNILFHISLNIETNNLNLSKVKAIQYFNIYYLHFVSILYNFVIH